ncbi:hypothetical protein BD779DRAFT_1675256 [Infundibulicybe gibba]|nr:hypothetical protein BD779DRAFT_1680828 [Infundibulicybe gibba]KAF8881736.1 hypothetical protein BD779DRAFT_1675256 [Infundibulicybe gibba]
MRRALEFCWWKARWWTAQCERRHTGDSCIDEGLKAYAMQQAEIERRRGLWWEQQWNAIRVRARIVIDQELSPKGHHLNLNHPSAPELVVELTLPEDSGEVEEYDDLEEF